MTRDEIQEIIDDCARTMNSSFEYNGEWIEVRDVVDKYHRYIHLAFVKNGGMTMMDISATYADMQEIWTYSVDRAAVNSEGLIFFNPRFMYELLQDKRRVDYVILHEMLHIALWHIKRTEDYFSAHNISIYDETEQYRANVAQDIEINDSLELAYPGITKAVNGICSKLPKYSRYHLWTWEKIYEDLRKENIAPPPPPPPPPGPIKIKIPPPIGGKKKGDDNPPPPPGPDTEIEIEYDDPTEDWQNGYIESNTKAVSDWIAKVKAQFGDRPLKDIFDELNLIMPSDWVGVINKYNL